MTGVIAGMIGGMITVPSEPTVLSATSNANAQSVLTWTAPARNGGSPITDYVVQYSTSATFASAVTTFTDGVNASTGATVTGLSNGTTYYFRVAAVNGVGTGLYSAISAGAIPSTVPSAPTITSSPSNVNGQVTVSWNALANTGSPRPDGGSNITSYTLQHSASSTFASGVVTVTGIASTSHPVSSLTNGTTRYFKVAGVNVNGTGTYSGTASGTPSTVPNAPTIVEGTANGVTASTVSWTITAANTGPNFTDVTGYKVEYAISPYSSYTVFNADTGNANTSISVTDLTNGGSYKFKVTAKNSNGFGTATESGVVVTNIVPAAPTISTVTLGTIASTTDTYSWTAPAANGGSAITTYYFASTVDNGATFIYTDIDLLSTAVSKAFDLGYTSAQIKIKVAAVNSLGRGLYSALSTAAGAWATASCTNYDASGCDSCGTKSTVCSKWTRSGNDDGPCNVSCGTQSACSGSWTDANASGTYPYPGHGNQAFTFIQEQGAFSNTPYIYMNADPQGVNIHGINCGGPTNGNYYAYDREYCSVTNTYRITPYGCVDTIFVK